MKNNPCEVSFYCLTILPIPKAAPRLIEKIYYSDQRLVIITEDEEMMKTIDDGLWVYSTKHFIPHATVSDEHPADQPIYITTKQENPNEATIMMSVGKAEIEQDAEKIIHLFDGNDKDQLAFARKKWKAYKAKGYTIIYWKQGDDGGWEKQG